MTADERRSPRRPRSAHARWQLQHHGIRRIKADKTGKDTNFRGLTIFNNVVYFTKGSGSNGVNTVYFIDTTGFNAAGSPWLARTASVCPGRREPPRFTDLL